MGAVNEVVDHADLETVALRGPRINAKSPQAQRMLKYAFNLLDDTEVASSCSPARHLAGGYDRRVLSKAVMPSSRSGPRSPPRYLSGFAQGATGRPHAEIQD